MSSVLQRRSMRWGLSIATAFLVGVSIGGVYLVTHQSSGSIRDGTIDQALPGEPRPLTAIFDPSTPLMPHGIHTTLAEASDQAGYAVLTPSGAGLPAPEVWFSADTGEVALRYGSSLVVLYSSWSADVNVAQIYEREAAEFQAGYTTAIQGNPGWVVPQDAQAPGRPPVNVVHETIGAVEITLYGRIPLEALLHLAGTI